MSDTLHTLIEAWSKMRRSDDPYGSVEGFAEEGYGDLWPYAIVHDQIESGWCDDDYRGALALNLARAYRPDHHALAAFVTLGGKWPANNATTALNLLVLAHRVALSSERWLDKFLSHAALECLKHGLRDPRSVVSEEAANIMGGLGPHHFATATSQDLPPLRDLADGVLRRIDQRDLAAFLQDRVETVLADASQAVATDGIGEADARRMLNELDPQWARMARTNNDIEPLATLRTHVMALAWRFASRVPTAIQVVYVYPAKSKKGEYQGWSIIEPWFAVVRSMMDSVKLSFVPVSAAGGSLLVTLRVEADQEDEDLISSKLRAARREPLTSRAAEDLSDMLRLQGVKIRVAHVETDLASASIVLGPEGSGVTQAPLRSRRLATSEIPQANELERMFDLVDRVASAEEVTRASIGVTTDRQVQYYKAASRLLSLLAEPTDALTRVGWLLHVAKGEDRYRRVCTAFEASSCGQSWIEWASATKLSDIPANSGEAFLADRSELTGDTVSRRASTINRWLEKLRRY